jgi:hypothetical protein
VHALPHLLTTGGRISVRDIPLAQFVAGQHPIGRLYHAPCRQPRRVDCVRVELAVRQRNLVLCSLGKENAETFSYTKV